MDNEEEIMNILETTNAYVKGRHFILASRNHSDSYVHVGVALAHPEHALTIYKNLADKFEEDKISVVVGFTYCGHILAAGVAEQLKARLVLANKGENEVILPKGHRIGKGENVLVVDDVLTTGGSMRQALNTIRSETYGVLKGVGVVVDRSKKAPDFGVKMVKLRGLPLKLWSPKSCPKCREHDIPTDLSSADRIPLTRIASLPEELRPIVTMMHLEARMRALENYLSYTHEEL
jgi:orotate phosphoribosyltransferase